MGMKGTALLLMLLAAGLPLFAQETPQASRSNVTSDYRYDEEGKIRQRISWTRANAYFYEIEIEKLGPSAVWEPELRERTEQNFLELSLPPGMYRYRILSYNVLGRVGAVSEWTGVRVFAARQPAAGSFSPAGYFIDSLDPEFTLVITGRNLAEEARVYIIAKQERASPIEPVSITYSPDEDTLIAVFPAGGLVLGAYDLVITNPGGMEQTLPGFRVGFSNPLDINLSLGYAPVLPAWGYLFDMYDAHFYPLGFSVRAGAVPLKRLWGWIGFDLGFFYTDMKTEDDAYRLSGRMTSVYADSLFQRWMRDYRMAVNLRLGAGITTITNIKFDHTGGSRSADVNTVVFTMNAAASVQWLVWKNMFVEGGLEFSQFFSSQSPQPGLFRVNIAAGKRFQINYPGADR
jgi:hypothetical protein